MPEINFQGKRIHYKTEGNGPAVMLVHGFGEQGDVFSLQTEFLKSDYRLIIPDLPGSGKSEALDGHPELDQFAEMLYEISLAELQAEKFHLFGHSMGGYITMAFVEKYAHRLKTFGLLHSSAFADTDEKIDSRKKAIEFIQTHGGTAFLKKIIPDLFAEQNRTMHPEYAERLFSLAQSIPDEVLVQYYAAMIKRPDRSNLLMETELPVFFLIGKHDTAVPPDASLQQSKMPKTARTHTLNDSGHMGMWEETEATNRALREFLDYFS